MDAEKHLHEIFLSTPSARRATVSIYVPNFTMRQRFLSTPSARRATAIWRYGRSEGGISIHALREEGDEGKAADAKATGISIHALREEGDRTAIGYRLKSIISIHALREEGDVRRPASAGRPAEISIHALREEGDEDVYTHVYPFWIFLSTPSARRATRTSTPTSIPSGYFYPRPPRGGRLYDDLFDGFLQKISIHALREEGDPQSCTLNLPCYENFYPRPPRGGRLTVVNAIGVELQFLSTPSARRATQHQQHDGHHPEHFYPRPPRGGRRRTAIGYRLKSIISIHALREEGDIFSSDFQAQKGISIHALREEGDKISQRQEQDQTYFYPRPPRGGRLLSGDTGVRKEVFLSTPSARRATMASLPKKAEQPIFLSTPSARRATFCCSTPNRCIRHFYPRPPRGGRPS